jgi:hypothetical protein
MVSTVKVQHDVTEEFMDTAKVLKRIAELAEKFSVKLPAPLIIDGQASEVAR